MNKSSAMGYWVFSIATITCARSSVATGEKRELAFHSIIMAPWRIEQPQSNHSEKNVALRCVTGTTDQSKTCSESQW